MQAKQTKLDSFLEAMTNTVSGFLISWGVWVFIVGPVFGIVASTGMGFAITLVFTVTSLLRSYIIRRALNGRSIYSVLRGQK